MVEQRWNATKDDGKGGKQKADATVFRGLRVIGDAVALTDNEKSSAG